MNSNIKWLGYTLNAVCFDTSKPHAVCLIQYHDKETEEMAYFAMKSKKKIFMVLFLALH